MLECENVGMFEWGFRRFRGNREQGGMFILFKHSNILTFKHFLLHIYRYD